MNGSLCLHRVRADWLRVQGEVAYVRMLFAGQTYFDPLQREQRFNPNHDDRGRFTTGDGATGGGGGGDAAVKPQLGDQIAQNKPRSPSRPVRVNGRELSMTLEQETRFIFAQNRVQGAVARIRELDSNWRSSAPPELRDPNDVEATIGSYLRLAQEAEARAIVVER